MLLGIAFIFGQYAKISVQFLSYEKTYGVKSLVI